MIGTNDMGDDATAAGAPARLAGLLDRVLAANPNALLVLAPIVPTRTDPRNVRVQAYNAAIPEMIRTRASAGKHVVGVDMYGAFVANAGYKTALLADELHPNDGRSLVRRDGRSSALNGRRRRLASAGSVGVASSVAEVLATLHSLAPLDNHGRAPWALRRNKAATNLHCQRLSPSGRSAGQGVCYTASMIAERRPAASAPGRCRAGGHRCRRSRFEIFLLVVVSLLGAAAVPRDARGCSFAGPLQIRTTIPDDGAAGIPTNTRVWVLYSVMEIHRGLLDGDPSWGDIRIRDKETGTEIDVERHVNAEPRSVAFTLVPRGLLRPETEYEVLDRVQRTPCHGIGGVQPMCFGALAAIARFRTGLVPDTKLPLFAGVREAHSGAIEECNSSACCGTYRGFRFSLEAAAEAVDDSVLAGYNVYDKGALIATLVPKPFWSDLFFCSGRFDYLQSANRSRGPYEMRAMDVAGNEEMNGVVVSIDSSACNSGGCAIGWRSPGAGGACAFLLLAALVWRRRAWRAVRRHLGLDALAAMVRRTLDGPS